MIFSFRRWILWASSWVFCIVAKSETCSKSESEEGCPEDTLETAWNYTVGQVCIDSCEKAWGSLNAEGGPASLYLLYFSSVSLRWKPLPPPVARFLSQQPSPLFWREILGSFLGRGGRPSFSPWAPVMPITSCSEVVQLCLALTGVLSCQSLL